MEQVEQVIVCVDGTLAHHWVIAPSKGASSKGTCKKCNQIKKFTNSMSAVVSWRAAGETFRSKQPPINLGDKDKKNGRR